MANEKFLITSQLLLEACKTYEKTNSGKPLTKNRLAEAISTYTLRVSSRAVHEAFKNPITLNVLQQIIRYATQGETYKQHPAHYQDIYYTGISAENQNKLQQASDALFHGIKRPAKVAPAQWLQEFFSKDEMKMLQTQFQWLHALSLKQIQHVDQLEHFIMKTAHSIIVNHLQKAGFMPTEEKDVFAGKHEIIHLKTANVDKKMLINLYAPAQKNPEQKSVNDRIAWINEIGYIKQIIVNADAPVGKLSALLAKLQYFIRRAYLTIERRLKFLLLAPPPSISQIANHILIELELLGRTRELQNKFLFLLSDDKDVIFIFTPAQLSALIRFYKQENSQSDYSALQLIIEMVFNVMKLKLSPDFHAIASNTIRTIKVEEFRFIRNHPISYIATSMIYPDGEFTEWTIAREQQYTLTFISNSSRNFPYFKRLLTQNKAQIQKDFTNNIDAYIAFFEWIKTNEHR